MNLELNPVQKEILAAAESMAPIRIYQLKARQMGVSTFWLLYFLDDTIFTPNTLTGIIADDKEGLSVLFEAVRLAHETMPAELRPKLGDDSKTSLSFPEVRSKIFVGLSFRSTPLHNLVVSELAHCDPAEVAASLAACPPDANVVMETTANGMNHAFDLWQESQHGLNGFRPMFFPWWRMPEYRLPTNGMAVVRTEEEGKLALDDEQIMYRRRKRRELRHLAAQELAEDPISCFIASGGAFFDNAKIAALLMEAGELQPLDTAALFDVWERPEQGHVYVAGADVAEGGGDYSVLAILCLTCRRTAARYRGRVPVGLFARVCSEWAARYNRAVLAVERNGPGLAVLLALEETHRYPNLYAEVRETRIGKPSEKKFGWLTTSTSRPTVLNGLKEALEGDPTEDAEHFAPEVMCLDRLLLDEAMTFRDSGGRYEAIAGKHDDLVMAYAIAWQMYLRQRNAERIRSLPGMGIWTSGRLECLENGGMGQ